MLPLLVWQIAAIGSSPARPAAVDPPTNVLLLVADDIGVDMLASYGLGSDLPATPNLDRMAELGVRFLHCWANPVCSPTRATLQTGRYAFRTGLGDVVGGIGSPIGLSPGEVTLAEALDLGGSGYGHALIGKWHLCVEALADPCAPLESGYGHFEGIANNPSPGYYDWTKVVNGSEFGGVSTYATSDQVDSALAWIATAPEPWLCVVNFSAPHSPYHAPPAGLHAQDLTGLDPTRERRPFYKAMVEALDTEIGRLLAGLGSAAPRTTTFFVGDNGTPQECTVAPFLPHHAKRTLYDGGVRVPLLAYGSLVSDPGTVSEALVNTTDLFATVLDVAGVDVPATLPPGRRMDGVSFLPQVHAAPVAPRTVPGRRPARGLAAPLPAREWILAERFLTGNGCGPGQAKRAIRNRRYKLHRYPNAELFFDLELDPFESTNLLLGGLTQDQQTNYDSLASILDGLLATPDCLGS